MAILAHLSHHLTIASHGALTCLASHTLKSLVQSLCASPPRRSSGSTMSSPTSPPSSCISSDMSQDDLTQLGYYSSSPDSAAKSMVLAGCQRCLMYFMLSQDDPKCPKCRNTVLLEFMQQGNHSSSASSSTSTNKKSTNKRMN